MSERTKYIRSGIQIAGGIEQDSHDPPFKASRYVQPHVVDKSGFAPNEHLPMFLGVSGEEEHPPQLQSGRTRDDREQDRWLQEPALSQNDWQNSGWEENTWEQEDWETRRRKGLSAPRIIKLGLLAASVVAVVFAVFTLQGKHALIADASASLASVLPGMSSAKAPVPVSPPIVQAAPVTPAAPPTRQAINSAFQTALQVQPPVQQPAIVVPVAPLVSASAPIRSIDPDELFALLKRAKSLIDTGDIAPARLLLERAADAHEARAAFILAQTYDPAVLGTADSRSITADPATARAWYQKAAEYGSQEARTRLTQMTN